MGTVQFDFHELDEFRYRLEQVQIDQFLEDCAKELAARLLRKVVKRTPVGDYTEKIMVTADRNSKHHKKGETYERTITRKQGGTLRRGWTAGELGSEGLRTRSVAEYVDTIKAHHYGNTVVIEISNPVEYAPYVEYGHRQEPGRYVPAIGKKLKQGWVPGKFMLTISEQEVRELAPSLLEQRLKQFLEEVLHDS